MQSSLSNRVGAEATLLKSTGKRKGRCRKQKPLQKSKDLKRKLKAKGGLCFVFQLEVWMETCDKGLERAEEGRWTFSNTHAGLVQSEHLRIPAYAPEDTHRCWENQQTRSEPGVGMRGHRMHVHRNGICGGRYWSTWIPGHLSQRTRCHQLHTSQHPCPGVRSA